MLGISAPSGKGKTTLINILLGFLEESSGEIIINGVHADTLERRKFWPEIAYVKQQPFLIHNSIRANIVLEEKGADEQLLQSAVQYTGLDDFINKQDAGIDMIITENGKNISGGQRQRVALARAFYKNASLIILDEAFNEMDEASETSILKYLQSFCAEGKMVILITHNKKSLSFCSKIYKFNEG
jgi:ABC-type transport system involved in cytochrome bd biosynthesis fused ATPase/permease subunit